MHWNAERIEEQTETERSYGKARQITLEELERENEKPKAKNNELVKENEGIRGFKA